MKKLFVLFIGFILVLGLSACNETQTEVSIDGVQIKTSTLQETYMLDEFNIEDQLLIIAYSDGTTSTISITENMVSASDLEKLNQEGTQTIEVLYQGYKVALTLTLTSKATNQYTVEHVDHDGTVLQTADYDFGADLTGVTAPIDPTREGYTFDTWSGTVPEKMGTDKIAVTATYTVNQYKVEYVDYDGTVLQTEDYDFGANLTGATTPMDPEREGYIFDGWDAEVPGTMPNINLLLISEWELKEYTSNYYEIGNSNIAGIELNQGETIKLEYITYKSGIFVTTFNRIFIKKQFTDLIDMTNEFNLEINEEIIYASTNDSNFIFITNHNRILGWGVNEYGLLGSGSDNGIDNVMDITSFFQIEENDFLTKVILSTYYAMGLTNNGTVLTWGRNDNGNIGIDSVDFEFHEPTQINNFINLNFNEKVIDIDTSDFHAGLITNENRVFMWGLNRDGQLGTLDREARLSPVEITNNLNLNLDEEVNKISIGGNTSSILTSEGRVIMWGTSYRGRIPLGDTSGGDIIAPLDITEYFNLAELDKIIDFSISSQSGIALSESRIIFTWGANDMNQLGFNTYGSHIYVPTEIQDQFSFINDETILYVSMNGKTAYLKTGFNRIFYWGYNSLIEETFPEIYPMILSDVDIIKIHSKTFNILDNIDLDYLDLVWSNGINLTTLDIANLKFTDYNLFVYTSD